MRSYTAATATVRYEYRPSLPDELSITRGEVLHVLSEYSDGWALCKNERGGEGVVPQACLDCGHTTQTLGAEKRDYRRPLSTPTPTMFPSPPPPKLLTILAERMELLAARLRRSRRKNLNSISELEAALDALLVETNSSDALPSSTHVPSSSRWKMTRKLIMPGVKMRRKLARSSNKAKHKIEIRCVGGSITLISHELVSTGIKTRVLLPCICSPLPSPSLLRRLRPHLIPHTIRPGW